MELGNAIFFNVTWLSKGIAYNWVLGYVGPGNLLLKYYFLEYLVSFVYVIDIKRHITLHLYVVSLYSTQKIFR